MPSSTTTPSAVKVVLIFLCLYFFLVGIGAMGTACKLLGKDYTKDLVEQAVNGPVVALFVGILITTLLQSSSTTTSLVVGFVAAGAIPLQTGTFMVMGANVGTTVTSTLVSLGHITRSGEYRRAFAAATVHDFFNLIVLVVLFPLELATGFLTTISAFLTTSFESVGGTKIASPIKIVTKPTIDLIAELSGRSGVITLIVAVLLTFAMLIMMVRLLRSVMLSRLENLFDRVIFKTPRRSLLFGILLTILVQSSSITTSVAVPLVGAGVLTLRQVFPYTMGANIGTTMTALLAALAAMAISQEPEVARVGLEVAFHHVLFNMCGVALVWWCRGVPIAMANAFARLAIRNRWLPLVYIIATFYLLPLVIIFVGSRS